MVPNVAMLSSVMMIGLWEPMINVAAPMTAIGRLRVMLGGVAL